MPTLYDKYGGTPTLKLMVREFYKSARLSPKIGHFFAKMDMEKLIDHQVQFLSFVLGKPVRQYEGNELLNAHQPLKITREDFDEIERLLVKTLRSASVTENDIALIIGVVRETRDDIVCKTIAPAPSAPSAPPAAVTVARAAPSAPSAPAARAKPAAPVANAGTKNPEAALPATSTAVPIASVDEAEPAISVPALLTSGQQDELKMQRKAIFNSLFGGIPKIKMIVRDLYSQVNEQADLRHYFLNVTPEKIIADQEHFAFYVLRKPDHTYLGNPLQTADLDIQVDANVFADVIDCLKDILRNAGLPDKDIPRVSTHVMEVIEETRTQCHDNRMGVLKSIDVSIDTLAQIYRRNKLEASIKGPDLLYAFPSIPSAQFPFPFFTQLDVADQVLTLICQTPAKENAKREEMEQLVREASRFAPVVSFDIDMQTENPMFICRYSLPYEFGVPYRLLIRIAQQFSKTFRDSLVYDSDKILLKVAL